MIALAQLERAGYEFHTEGDGTIRYVYRGVETPDDSLTRPLLVEIRDNRQEVASILAMRASVSTSYEGFTNRTKRYIVFPADTPLPFPAGSWRRLDDGRIEALLSYDDLQAMRYWRDEVLK